MRKQFLSDTHTPTPLKTQEVEISVDVACVCTCTRTLSILHKISFLIIIYQTFWTVFLFLKKDSSIKIGLKFCSFNYEGAILLIIQY